MKKYAPRSNLKLSFLIVSAVAFAGASAAASGCVGEQPNSIMTLSSSTTGGSGATTGTPDEDAGVVPGQAEELFAAIEPELMKVCGACHQPGGLADTPFLHPPNNYQTMVSWPGLVKKDPAESLLLKYSVKGGGHSGINLDADTVDPKLLEGVKAWLDEEAKAIAEPPPDVGPSIEPFVPILGFNAVYLGPLGADFEGMAITFNAEEVGTQSLKLTQVEVHTTSKLGLHLVHPLFVVYPLNAGADPDPVDSFSNIDDTFDPGTGSELGPGTVVLTNWKAKAKLSVAFELIEKIDNSMPDGGMDGGTGGCKDVAAFQANAQQRFSGNCVACHGGGNQAAKGALDMSAINSDPAAACAQIRYRVKPADPPSSQIFVTTNPNGNAAHPFKFAGNANVWEGFRTEVSKWIAAEN